MFGLVEMINQMLVLGECDFFWKRVETLCKKSVT